MEFGEPLAAIFISLFFIYLFIFLAPSLSGSLRAKNSNSHTQIRSNQRKSNLYIYIFLNSIQRERERLTGDVVVFGGDAETDVVGQDGHHVDDGHDAAHKLAPVRSSE